MGQVDRGIQLIVTNARECLSIPLILTRIFVQPGIVMRAPFRHSTLWLSGAVCAVLVAYGEGEWGERVPVAALTPNGLAMIFPSDALRTEYLDRSGLTTQGVVRAGVAIVLEALSLAVATLLVTARWPSQAAFVGRVTRAMAVMGVASATSALAPTALLSLSAISTTTLFLLGTVCCYALTAYALIIPLRFVIATQGRHFWPVLYACAAFALVSFSLFIVAPLDRVSEYMGRSNPVTSDQLGIHSLATEAHRQVINHDYTAARELLQRARQLDSGSLSVEFLLSNVEIGSVADTMMPLILSGKSDDIADRSLPELVEARNRITAASEQINMFVSRFPDVAAVQTLGADWFAVFGHCERARLAYRRVVYLAQFGPSSAS